MTSRERLINAYAKMVIDGKCSIDTVPLSIKSDIISKVSEHDQINL